jgi:hypothetical protein
LAGQDLSSMRATVMTNWIFAKTRAFERLRRATNLLTRTHGQGALLCTIALTLRLYAIERQSLWDAEGSSISVASHTSAQIARDTAVDARSGALQFICGYRDVTIITDAIMSASHHLFA